MPDKPHAWTVETGVGGILVAVPPSELDGGAPPSLDVDGGALGGGSGILGAGGYDRGTVYGASGSRLIGPLGQGPSAGVGPASFASKDVAIVHSGDAALRYTFADGGLAADWQGIFTNDPTVGQYCCPLRPGVTYRVTVSARTDSVAGGPQYRILFTHDQGGTLTSLRTIAFVAALAWQTDDFVFTVPMGASPNSRLAIQFQRGATAQQDFWVDSIRMDEVGQRMRCKAYPSGPLTITNNTLTKLAFDAEAYDVGELHASKPIVVSRTATPFGASTTSHPVTLPSTLFGELLLLFFSNDVGGTTVATPAGWTLLSSTTDAGANVRFSLFARVASGNEGGTTVDLITSAAREAAAQVHRIRHWSGSLAAIEVGTAQGVSTTPDPPSLNPAGWGTEETLWLAAYGANFSDDASGYPASYSDGTYTESSTGLASASMATAWRQNPVASEDPGNFTLVGTDQWVAMTVAIRPLAAAGADNTRITIPTGGDVGAWIFVAQVNWDTNAAGHRKVEIYKNNSAIVAMIIGPPTQGGLETVQQVTYVENAPAAGDFFEVRVLQTSGGDRSVFGAVTSTSFAATHLW